MKFLESIQYTLKEKKSGEPVVVYWLAVPMETDFETEKATIYLTGESIEQPVIVDLLDGCVYEVNPVKSNGRTIYENLPVGDSPLVLCSRDLLTIK